jgi:peptide/nickel transport system substrate-binding protein
MLFPAVRRSLIALTLTLLGCRPAPPSTVTLAVRADVIELSPKGAKNDSYTIGINDSLFEGLVGMDGQLRLQAALAERWENPDEHTYLFTLRPGLKFSDGSPLTARDVVASLQAARTDEWETRDYLRAIESVRLVSDRQVEVRTREVSLGFLTRLPWGYVVPERVLGQPAPPAIGTGPYRLESRTRGREFVLRRNPHFRGPQPAFERARFVVLPDENERVARVEQGQADLADHVSSEAAGRLAHHPGLRVVRQSGPQTLFLALRVDLPPFSDPRLREAFDLALDRDELIRRALPGAAQPASQVVPPTILGHNPTLTPTRPDRPRARQLLAEAGHRQGLSVRLDAPNNRYPGDVAIAHEVARQLAEVGVGVELNLMDKARFFTWIDAGLSRFHLLGWICQSGDAGDILDSLLHSQTRDDWGVWNTLGLADPELDRLIEQGARSTSDSERSARLRAALARVAEVRPLLPLATPDEIFLVSSRIEWTPPLDTALHPADMRPARSRRP